MVDEPVDASAVSAEVAVRDDQAPVISAPGQHEWNQLWTQAEALARSSIVPGALRGKPADLMVIWLTGRELQIPPMQALGKIHVIDGKASMSAELMASLVLRAGHEIVYKEQSAQACRLEVRRRGQESWSSFEFTIDDAITAGLCSIKDGKPYARSSNGKKLPWEQYPKSMLSARALSLACRAMFPDVMMGVSYVPEELGAEVDAFTGEVIGDPDIETITDDEAGAFLHRIRALNEGYQKALRETLKERGWVVRRLPARLKQALDDEIAGLEQWDSKPATTAVDDLDVVVGEVVPPVGQTETEETDDDDVTEAVVVDEAGSESAAAPAAAPASEDLPPPDAEASHAPTLPGDETAASDEAGGEDLTAESGPEADVQQRAPENGPGGADRDGGESDARGSESDVASPGPVPAADVGGGLPAGTKVSTKSQWTKLAMAAGDAGLDDDGRHELVALISMGRTNSAKALSHLECQWAINTCREIAAGHVKIDDYDDPEDDTPAYRTVIAQDELGLKFCETLTKTLGGE